MKTKSIEERLCRQFQNGEISMFWGIPALDFQKFGIIMQSVGRYMAVKEKFRATLEYDPEVDKYYLSLTFYERDIPVEILAYQKALEYLRSETQRTERKLSDERRK